MKPNEIEKKGIDKVKYKSKLKRNSKYDPHSKRFINHAMLSNPVSIEKCENKMAYQTINKARQAKKKIEKDGSVMEIYKCPHCKKFHLTSMERKEKNENNHKTIGRSDSRNRSGYRELHTT